MNRFLIVCGPTATGKTAIAVSLAEKFNGELVSADSRQIYRGMDVGTGKDTEFLQGVSIGMYDVVNPDEPFSVSQYQKIARNCIADIRRRRKLAIVVGGSGLYIQSLVETIPSSTVKPNMTLRAQLAVLSISKLQKIAQEEIPDVWKTLNVSDQNNQRRLVRKIELGRAGMPMTRPMASPDEVLWIGLTAPFPELYKRIDKRVNQRMQKGMEREIMRLLKKGYGWDLPYMSGLGYRQWKEYVNGKATREEVIQKWKFGEHAYARRQMTWFRRNKEIHWFDVSRNGYAQKIESLVKSWYTNEQ